VLVIDAGDLKLLQRAQGTAEQVTVVLSSCVYSCCGRSFARAGYEQSYTGRIAHVDDNAFLLYANGIGTLSYVVAARYEDVECVG
jgi:hypothetical protein